MAGSRLLEKIRKRDEDSRALAARIAGKPESIAEVLDGLTATEANVKYGCAKILEALSEENPGALYPQFDRLVAFLHAKNRILTWEAIRILANLSRADSEGKIEALLDTYFGPIRGPVLITAANIIKGSATIARAKPHLTPRVVNELLGIEKASYRTPECRNIALGKAIDALDAIFEQIEDPKPVLRFVRKQQHNPRQATRRRAERFLKRRGAPPRSRSA
jgi:hypothetical protein